MDLRLRFRRRKPPEGLGAALSLTLTALKESADAFPPLKSVVGAVVHIRDLRLKVKSNRDEFDKLVSRAETILKKLADIVHDPTMIPPDLLGRIEDFTRVVTRIGHLMESRSRRKVLRRLLSHREDEGVISDFNRQLDNLERQFKHISVIKLEIAVAALARDQESRFNRMEKLSSGNARLSMQRIAVIHMLSVLFDLTSINESTSTT